MDTNFQSELKILSHLAKVTEYFNESNSYSATTLLDTAKKKSVISFFQAHLGKDIINQCLPYNGTIEDYVDTLIDFYLKTNDRLPGCDPDPGMAEWEGKIYLETGGTGNEFLRRAIMARRHAIDMESKFSELYLHVRQH